MKKISYICIAMLLLFASCDEEGGVIFEVDISDREVLLLSPTQGSNVSTTTVRFDWEHLEDATAYDIQVAQPNFENAAQILVNQRVDSLTTFQQVLPSDSYEWRVRAVNSAYETPYSAATFTVDADGGLGN